MEAYSPYMPWIIMVVNGLIAGWLAGILLGGGGLIRNIFVGIIGSFIGGSLVQAGVLKLPDPHGLAVGPSDPGVDDRRDPDRDPRPPHRALAGLPDRA